MKKNILVDLSALKDPNTGLGQVALSYLKYFEQFYHKEEHNFHLTLLVPSNLIGSIGDKVDYISSTKWLNKRFQFLLPTFDVWHATHQLSKFMPKSKKTKFIYTIHDLNYLQEKKGASRFRKHRKTQKKINRATSIVCISKFTQNDVMTNLDLHGKDCRVIYNQVKMIERTNVKKPINIKEDTPFFFALGVIKRSKNFHVLLDLMKFMPDKHLYIAGIDTGRKHIRSYADMIKQRIADENITNVTLLGHIAHEEKIWLYENCQAVLIPSLLEGFGLPLIEAMQFNKPVFSSNATCLPEIGDKHAFYWDNFEPEYMKKIIDDNLNAFYADSNLREEQMAYAESFASNRHFEEYMNLYETI